MKRELLFLGTGASMGIPVIGCTCDVCSSTSPFNQRLRPSALYTEGDKRFLIDIGPDFRTQALKYGINDLDGVLITHTHYDHIAGLDDLRIFCFRKQRPMPCFVSLETLEEIKVRYHYILPPSGKSNIHAPKFDFHVVEEDSGEAVFEGLKLSYFSYTQMGMKITGFRMGNFAYVTDLQEYSDSIFESLKGVDTLVVDGMAWERTNSHLSMPEVLAFAEKAGAKKTYLTHIAHETDYEKISKKLPEGAFLAYDGLKLELE